MIAFKYVKTDGAEYLSHLDLLRHIYRTMRRAGIEVNMSEGFHAHPRIFLNNPLPVGIASVAEYGAADTPFTGNFKELFNKYSPAGVKCEDFKTVTENPNYANSIERCAYSFEGIADFDFAEITEGDAFIATDLRGRELDLRKRIYSLEKRDGRLIATLGYSGNNLRADLFAYMLVKRFGGSIGKIIKIAAYGKGVF